MGTERKPIIAGNWKMNNTKAQAESLIKELIPLVENADCDVVICVPYTVIETAAKLTKGTVIKVGAQNIAWADKGAFTGEVSADMLREAGAEYVIIGHSERRQYFGEIDESVNKRTVQALKTGFKPIVCVGEMLSERESGKTEEVCKRQTEGAFVGISAEDAEKIVVAYEPVWAIGTGKTATSAQAQETISYIRSVLSGLYGKNAAAKIRIQYGGSMNPGNARELMARPDIDGGLIGGASLKAHDFSAVVNYNK